MISLFSILIAHQGARGSGNFMVKRLFQRGFGALEGYREYLRVRSELSAFTERELKDIGISRSDIEHIAKEAAALKHG